MTREAEPQTRRQASGRRLQAADRLGRKNDFFEVNREEPQKSRFSFPGDLLRFRSVPLVIHVTSQIPPHAEIPSMIRVLAIMQTAFSLWMLYDAIRRRCGYHWYFLIMVPFGEWAYFFMVKIHDPELRPLKEAFFSLFQKTAKKRKRSGISSKKAGLEEIRYRRQETPSFDNTLQLARALYDAKHYEESADLFCCALRLEESDDALYGLALSQIRLKRRDEAIGNLQKLIERSPDHEEYDGWPHLALALAECGRGAEAVELLERLVETSPRLNHRMLLAHYLLRNGQVLKARQHLEAGLCEYRHAPPFLQKRQKAWARQAKKMLQQTRAQPA